MCDIGGDSDSRRDQGRGGRFWSSEEQQRELTRNIRREVSKLSEKWNTLIDRSDQWGKKLEKNATVSEYVFIVF